MSRPEPLELRWLDRAPSTLSTPMIKSELIRILRHLGVPTERAASLRTLADRARALDREDPAARRASTLAAVLFARLG